MGRIEIQLTGTNQDVEAFATFTYDPSRDYLKNRGTSEARVTAAILEYKLQTDCYLLRTL